MLNSGDKKALGALGEKAACQFLKNQGFKILTQNFRFRRLGELDIVAAYRYSFWRNLWRIHFIEVKTKVGSQISLDAQQSWTPKQQKRLLKLTQIYLSFKNIPSDTPWQIDLITITFQQTPTGKFEPQIKHYQNVLEDTF
jgi:putative endonuclease